MNIKLGLCGIGNMGKKHQNTISRNSSCNLLSVYDPGVPDYSSWEKFSKSLSGLDGIIVACPSEYHVTMCKKILEKNPGLKILLEKPISHNVETALSLREWNKNILIGQVERFNPAVMAMREEWLAGNTGKVFSIQTRRYSYPNRPLKSDNNNVATDLLVHDVDAIQYIFDKKLTKVSYSSKSLVAGFTEMVNLHLTDVLDTHIVCSSNWLTPKSVRDMTILCERGMYVLDYMDQSLGLYTLSDGQQVRKKIYFSPERKMPLDAELNHFLDMITNDTEPLCSVNDAVSTLQIIMDK
mgnify:FL=1|jgi:UDP-N-acetylglucosamine 3-dehydrogenase|tara:strand:+ start:2073 stop:2960 length:888 start_codon:yes stop_codon:yes gene_type:complete